jgi:hypothetical protein
MLLFLRRGSFQRKVLSLTANFWLVRRIVVRLFWLSSATALQHQPARRARVANEHQGDAAYSGYLGSFASTTRSVGHSRGRVWHSA